MINERELREEICTIGHRLYYRNYIVGTDGNLSVRLPGDILIFTPSGVCKGELHPDRLLKTDLHGKKISGEGKPSSEIQLHLVAYRQRPDIRAVVHAHPPLAVALTVAGESLEKVLVPEVVTHLHHIPTAPYATPGSKDLAESISPFIVQCDAVLLERHGIVTVGNDLKEAYYKLECAEYAAKITWLARQLGPLSPLDAMEVSKLQEMRNPQRKAK